jgi:O-Antigen ligase
MSRPHSLALWLRSGAGWLLVVALFYSPWDYGGTGAASIRNLNRILGAMVILWVAGCALRRNRARDSGSEQSFWSWTLLSVSLAVLLIGWGMTLNARALWDTDYLIFQPLIPPLPRAPGAVDYALSLALMWRVTALLGCVWVVAGLAQNEKWLLRIWWSIGLAGASIALLGLIQKATGAELPFWEMRDRGEPPVTTFFASYYYHGNAGAFLNLALPAILGLAFRYATRRGNPIARALWVSLSLLAVVAVISNTSRMGQFIAVVIALTVLILAAGKFFGRVRHLELKTVLLALLVGAVAIWAVTRVSHLDRSLGRWDNAERSVTQDARWVVDEVALHTLPEAGALGFGPGTFSVVFPFFNQSEEGAAGEWLFLHNDYLQTLMEWGWLGGSLAFLICGCAMVVALWSLTNKRASASWSSRRRQFLPLAVIALVGVGLHAAVDFPLQISSIQLYAAIYLGICWGSGAWGRGGRYERRVEAVS